MIQNNRLLVLLQLFVISLLTMVSGKLKISYPFYWLLAVTEEPCAGHISNYTTPWSGTSYFASASFIGSRLEYSGE